MARESLSALLDGECTPAEMERLLAELEASPELMQEWSRMCLARESREGTRVTQDQPCICAGVMAGLDAMDEPANPRVVDLASRRQAAQPAPARKTQTPFWKPLAGLAAAACVAAVAILISTPGTQPGADNLAASVSPGVQPQAVMPVSFPVVRSAGMRSVALRPEELRQRDELNELLLEHNGSMTEQGMGGTLRYARYAAHTAEYHPQEGGEQP